ncbi:hypothetical protein EYF80_042521 [Liparis tanakae]|uniref:Uncharacterized protein n=1 Tax=Liparis tanakae TaxID=230148 RepID=A0A4Z2G365_9TELE|nr:hypothetical protein EYF80_042521 [Liparis tanakae]
MDVNCNLIGWQRRAGNWTRDPEVAPRVSPRYRDKYDLAASPSLSSSPLIPLLLPSHPSPPPLSSLCSLTQVKVALGQKAFL